MFRFKLVSLSGIQFDDDVYEVLLPTMEGEIGVLAKHMPLVSVAKTGVIAVRREARDPDDAREYFATNGGVIEVEGGELRVLVDEADHAADINEAEAQAAYDRAQKMKSEATDEVSLERAQQLVDRHAVRLQVTSLKRRHQNRS
ncbi:MAG TPA: ATP synthase F1 subunit epsilon [Candidatus Saccharimonadales bacterium]|jgi:F-type H+-transporting ATPase subunit epsilon